MHERMTLMICMLTLACYNCKTRWRVSDTCVGVPVYQRAFRTLRKKVKASKHGNR